MVDFNTWMSIGLQQCAPSGQGTQRQRNQVFRALVDGWNSEKEQIQEMTPSEVRESVICP